MAQIVTRVHSRMVDLAIEGAPDVDNHYGPDRIRPTQIQITYWYGEGGKEEHASAYLFGLWVQDGKETEHAMNQTYDRSQDWPTWLADLAKANRP